MDPAALVETGVTVAIPLEDLEASARGIGDVLREVMPEGVGFALVLFDFGDKGHITYVSRVPA